MTRDRDIERVLDRWFAEGPTQMPDHLFETVVDRIDRVPQRRLARIQTRLLAMNSNLRLAAAAAAIIVVVAGVGAFSLSQRTSVGVGPSPTPTVTPIPSPTLSLLPTALRQRWIGPTRTVAGMVPAPLGAGIVLSSTTIHFDGGDPTTSTALFSTASAVGSDQLRFVLNFTEAGCTVGDVGTYRFVLSPGGGYLSLTVVNDPCQARSQAISGDWERSTCPNQNGGCLGDLEAGTHTSAQFNPFVPRGAYTYAYGRLTYSVPSGWTNSVDGPDGYVLAKQGASDGTAIYAFSTALADSQAAGCPGTVEPGVGKTATRLALWLTTRPGLVTTTPVPVNVGGLSGKTIDVKVAPTWTRTCPYSTGKPYVPMFTNGISTTNFDWGLAAGGRMRLFLLDLPDGRTMLIDIESPDSTTFDAFVADAMSVIPTFRFHP
jgi:hypothetical protein